MKSKLIIALFFLTIALLLARIVFSQELYTFKATLSWDRNKETDLAGYNIYFDHELIDSTSAPFFNLDSLGSPILKHYYQKITFTVTAFDTSGNESPPSNPLTAFFCQSPKQLFTDVNNDGIVNGLDLYFLYQHYNSQEGDSLYDEIFDFNGDSRIDSLDKKLLLQNIGREK